ncbi:ABC transporter substrate-binding protein [Devosia sp.]|uniref:ABC transporter substrate-binding protein n=1 Tax=Devosia sp. TaxID=1871048 RepID=UPI002EFC1810
MKTYLPALRRRSFLVGASSLGLMAAAFPTLSLGQSGANVLRIGTLGLDTVDPHRHTGTIAVQQVYVEALTSIAPDGSVEPWLAEAIDARADGLAYTFKLRPNVHFHNGDTLTASDVVANFSRVKEKITGGWLVSAMEYVDSVEAPDELTVVVNMSAPYAPLLNLLSELWIVSPKSEGWDDTINRPIGTGPFTFGAWQPKDSFTAPAFDNYWVAGLPKVSALWFDIRDEADKALALQAGDLHIAMVSAEAAETIKAAGVANVDPLGDATWYFMAFNNRSARAPFDDIRVRQAIGHAIDKAAFMNFEAGPTAVTTNQMSKPGTFYFDQAMHDADPFKAPDLERARSLLAEAGVNPAEHTVRFVSWQEDYAQVIVQMVRQLGFQVEHAALDDVAAQQRLSGDDWDMNVMSSGPRSDIFLRYVRLMSNGPNPTLWGNIQNPALDAVIDAASKEVDSDKRRGLYLEAIQMVHDNMYFVVLGHAARLFATRHEVKDFKAGFSFSLNWASGGVAHASL